MTASESAPPSRPSFFKQPPPSPVAPSPPPPPPTASRSVPPPPPPAPPTAGGPPGWDPSARAVPRQRRRLLFHGTGGTLFGIHIVNVLLTIVTLGVYYFWAKTRVRVYMLSQTEFEGDRFAWHGTGPELLVGFLKAMVIFFIPLSVLGVIKDVPDVSAPLHFLAAVLGYALVVVVLPLAMVGSRRYRLSRISWRGIRFSFRGPVWDFVRIFIVGSVLTSLTLGIYYPFFDTRRHAFMTSHAWFGNRRFRFDGEGGELFRPFLLAVLLILPTLGLVLFWYWARKRRFFWDHTAMDEARFRCTVTGGRLALLTLGNVVLLVGTLGLAWPWVKVRNARFTCANLTIDGPLDLDQIQQDAQAASTTGEGLAGLLDSGSGFDFG